MVLVSATVVVGGVIVGITTVVAGVILYIFLPKKFAQLKSKLTDECYATELIPLSHNPQKFVMIIDWITKNTKVANKNTNVKINNVDYRIPLTPVYFNHSTYRMGFQIFHDVSGNVAGIQLWTWSKFLFKNDEKRVKALQSFVDQFGKHVEMKEIIEESIQDIEMKEITSDNIQDENEPSDDETSNLLQKN